MQKVIVNPKTGKMETVDVPDGPSPESLARQRKELRDMLDGNIQFHVDPRAAKPAVKPTPPDEPEEDGTGWGFFF